MKLSAQLSEAVKLKEFRDRKGVTIEKMLENYLEIGEQRLCDYDAKIRFQGIS